MVLAVAAITGIGVDQMLQPSLDRWWWALAMVVIASAAVRLTGEFQRIHSAKRLRRITGVRMPLGQASGSAQDTRPFEAAAIAEPARRASIGPTWWSLLLFTIACCFGLRHGLATERHDVHRLDGVLVFEGEPGVIEGVVAAAPRLHRARLHRQSDAVDASPFRTTLIVDVQTWRRGYDSLPAVGRVMALIDRDASALLPGDSVRLLGTFDRFDPPGNPGQRDLRDWAIRDGIDALMRVTSLDIPTAEPAETEPPRGFVGGVMTSLHRWLTRCGRSGRETLMTHVGPEQGPLAMALVLGQRELLDQATSDTLLVTGTAHLLSVSGLHLAIVIGIARALGCLANLSNRGQVVSIILVAAFYVAITGGRPPVIRSAILLGTLLASVSLARPHEPVNALSLAALLLAWFMPAEVFGVGVQLSFVAVATLLLCGGAGTRRDRRSRTAAGEAARREEQFDALEKSSRGRWSYWVWSVVELLRQSFWYSGCVFAMTLPLIWEQFHVVSWVSIAMNVVLSAMMPVALVSGVATVVAGWIWMPAASVPGWFCEQILTWMQTALNVGESIPMGHLWLPSPPLAWVAAFYIGVLLVLFLGRPGSRRRMAISVWAVTWWTAAWWTATTPASLPPGTLEATFVDVGHGTSVIVRDDSATWIYDCGWLGNADAQSEPIQETLWSLGIVRLNGVCLSHADADHFNALSGLAARFQIDRLITPPGMLAEPEPSLDLVREAVKRHRLVTAESAAGDTFRFGGGSPLTVLHPPAKRVAGSDNANSLVIRLDHAGRTLLLPGDLEPPGTDVVVNQLRPIPGSVMMAPHHGSLRMEAEKVLAWARPADTVVSGGRRAAQPDVAEMLGMAGSRVWVTASSGAIRVRIDSQGQVEIRRWRFEPW